MSADFELLKNFYYAVFPPGSIWIPEYDKGFDQLLDAFATSKTTLQEFLATQNTVRRSQYTDFLDELEEEHGIIFNPDLTEAQRRENIFTADTREGGIGQADYLQGFLRDLGFDVYVHVNNPPVDPNQFLFEAYNIYSGGENAYSGNESAISGGVGGSLLVNGELSRESSVFSVLAGGIISVSGNAEALSGARDAIESAPVIYTVPEDQGYWGLFFFVGGPATRNLAGELTDIETANVPIFRKSEFLRWILQIKPLHTWAGLIINYAAD